MTTHGRVARIIETEPVALVPLTAADRRTLLVALRHWDAWWRQHPTLLLDASARTEWAHLQDLITRFAPVRAGPAEDGDL
jgi:hypothetical protein